MGSLKNYYSLLQPFFLTKIYFNDTHKTDKIQDELITGKPLHLIISRLSDADILQNNPRYEVGALDPIL